MWKPSTVVEHHRKRATVIWCGLLVAIVCYTIWEVSIVINQQENPSTKFSVSNERYSFPYVSVCLYDGFGCSDPEASTDACVESALEFSDAEYNGESVSATQDEYSNCVGFDLSQFQVPEGERQEDDESVLIVMYWTASEDPAAETEYSESVDITLGSSTVNQETTTVPYSRNLASSTDEIYDISAMTIGKTHRTFLSDDPVTSYPALTISTTKYVVPERSYQSDDTTAGDFATGMLYLQISQGSFSLTEVDDIEPQLFGTLMGNVGGFWELLLLAWGLFFISSTQARGEGAAATMEARNFTGSLKKACCCGGGGDGAGSAGRSAAYKTNPSQDATKGRSDIQDEQEDEFDASENEELEGGFE